MREPLRKSLRHWGGIALLATCLVIFIATMRFALRFNNGSWLYGQGDWGDTVGCYGCFALPFLLFASCAWLWVWCPRRFMGTLTSGATCPKCGYDLTGLHTLDQRVCPECGQPFDAAPS